MEAEPQPTKTEEEEEEEGRRPGLLKRIQAQRPVFRRVLKKVRQPITTTTAQPEDQGAFLVCSEGRCFNPSTQEEISDTDLEPSASSELPEEVMRLLEEMKLLEQQEKSEEVRQNHIKLLLETAKVQVPDTPNQTILETDDLIEMLRSQGILPSIENDVDPKADLVPKPNAIPTDLKKEIDYEEDFGVLEMETVESDDKETLLDQIRFLESALPIKEETILTKDTLDPIAVLATTTQKPKSIEEQVLDDIKFLESVLPIKEETPLTTDSASAEEIIVEYENSEEITTLGGC